MICFTQLERHPFSFLAEVYHIITARLQELFIPKIEMGTAVVINNTTTNIDIPLTRGPIFLAGWFICMYLELSLPLNTRKTSASSTWTRTWDVFCDALVARFTNTSEVLVCGDDADVFILLFHHAHRLCDVIMELLVAEQLEMHKCPWAGKKNRPTNEWDVSICCTVVQNRPKAVGINSNPHFYSRYVEFWLPSMRTLAATIQYYSVTMERTGLSIWWWVNRIIQMLLRIWMRLNCHNIMPIASWKLHMHVL